MVLLKNHKVLLLILYALYGLCNLHIANCDGLTDVYNQDLSKIDKTIGWVFLIGATVFVTYIIYKGIYPPDSINSNISENLDISTLPVLGKQPNDSKIIKEPNNLTDLQESEYLKSLQILVSYK